MRRGNLPDGGHDKVIWKRSRDLLTRRFDNVTPRRGEDVPQRCYWGFHLGLTGDVEETSFGVSFETYFRRRGDVLMGLHCYVFLRRCQDVPIRRSGDVPLRRLGDVPLRRRWVFHLRPTYDVTGTYRETSLRRCRDVLLPGGMFFYIMCKNTSPLNFMGYLEVVYMFPLTYFFFPFSRFFLILEEFL